MGLQPAAAWQLSHGTASGPCGFGRCALATAERDPTKTTQDKVSKIMKEIRVNALGDTKATNDTKTRDDPYLWFDKDFPVDPREWL